MAIADHRITKLLRLEGISGDHHVQPSCSSRVTWIRLPRTMSRWILNISKSGHSTTSLRNLCQCLITLTVKKCFLVFRQNLPCFSLCPLPLVLSPDTTENSLAPSSLPLLSYLYTLIRSSQAFSSLGWAVPALSAFPHMGDAPVSSSSSRPFTGLSLVCPCPSCTG